MACLGAVRARILTLPGVKAVAVRGRDRSIDVTLEPGKSVAPAAVAKTIRDAGFTAETFDLTACGRVERDGDHTRFAITGLEGSFPLTNLPEGESPTFIRARLAPPYEPRKARLWFVEALPRGPCSAILQPPPGDARIGTEAPDGGVGRERNPQDFAKGGK